MKRKEKTNEVVIKGDTWDDVIRLREYLRKMLFLEQNTDVKLLDLPLCIKFLSDMVEEMVDYEIDNLEDNDEEDEE